MAGALPEETLAGKTAGEAAALIGQGVYEALRLENVVAARENYGGTAPGQVKAAVGRARAWLAEAKARQA